MTPAAGPDGRPLEGLRVVVTRAAHQAEPTVQAFEEAGARVERLPLLEVVPPDDPAPLERALEALESFQWLVFTSPNAVGRVLDRLAEAAAPAALPAGVRVASLGSATTAALRERGVEPDLEAADARAEGVAAELVPLLERGGPGEVRVLLPQAADARPVLAAELRRTGAAVERVDAYTKRVPPEAPERAREIFGTARLGWVTFTSPSIARSFVELGARLWDDDWPVRRRGLFAVSIGPVTSDALRALGVEPAAEAATPGDHELVAAVVQAVASRSLGRA